jgi:Fic family protein
MINNKFYIKIDSMISTSINLPMLPPNAELETKAVLKQLVRANRALAELKGYADTIPNKHILINAVMINEAKDNIISS